MQVLPNTDTLSMIILNFIRPWLRIESILYYYFFICHDKMEGGYFQVLADKNIDSSELFFIR